MRISRLHLSFRKDRSWDSLLSVLEEGEVADCDLQKRDKHVIAIFEILRLYALSAA